MGEVGDYALQSCVRVMRRRYSMAVRCLVMRAVSRLVPFRWSCLLWWLTAA